MNDLNVLFIFLLIFLTSCSNNSQLKKTFLDEGANNTQNFNESKSDVNRDVRFVKDWSTWSCSNNKIFFLRDSRINNVFLDFRLDEDYFIKRLGYITLKLGEFYTDNDLFLKMVSNDNISLYKGLKLQPFALECHKIDL